MLCPSCGSTLQEGSTFCPSCGATFETAQAAESSTAKTKKKFYAIAAVAMLLVVVVSVVAIVISSFDSPVEIAEDYVVAERSYNYEEVFETYPDFLLKGMAKKLGMEELDRKALAAMMLKLQNVDEDEIKDLDVDIAKSEIDEDIGENKAEKMIKEVFALYGCEKYASDIDDAAVVKVSYEVDDKEGDREVLCAKIDGEWYVIPLNKR